MPDTFDIKYTLLPPELQAHLWVLGLDANTSKVNIAYQAGAFRTSLAYNYGGSLEASIGIQRYKLSVSLNPSSRRATKRLRHFPTVARDTPNSPATSMFDAPVAHASTIRQRNANRCALLGRRAHRSKVARSSSPSTSSAFAGPRSTTAMRASHRR